MAITTGAESRIKEKYTTRDQKILYPNIYIKDFPLEPSGLFLKTNNFVQQGLNRILGYNEDEKSWFKLRAGSDGGLILSRDTGTSGAVFLTEREAKDVTVFDAISVGAFEIISHVAEDISGYSRVTVLISSTGNITLYFQLSDDKVNWYDVKTFPDTDLSFNCSNEKTAIQLVPVGHYFRVVAYATTASTITCVIHGCV